MPLIKTVSAEVVEASPAEVIQQLKREAQRLRDSIAEDKAKMDLYTKQYEELKKEARKLGIEDLKTVESVLDAKKEEAFQLIQSIEKQLALIENKLNG